MSDKCSWGTGHVDACQVYTTWAQTPRGTGAVARISEKGLGGHLEKLDLAATPNIPAPSAEVEAALTAICGKCPDCGEECRPHSQRGQAWIIGCGSPAHAARSLDTQILQQIISALNLRCPACGAIGVARAAGKDVFVGCPNYSAGCPGKPASLSDLFGTV